MCHGSASAFYFYMYEMENYLFGIVHIGWKILRRKMQQTRSGNSQEVYYYYYYPN